MKDAYSFDTSVEGLNKSYDAMYAAYCRIFSRCGLDYLAVEAESGPIGGDASHEFMVLADNGEDSVVHCKACGYAANLERAETGARSATAPAGATQKPLTKLDTPMVGSIEQVSKLLKCKPHAMIKTLIYLADDQPIAVLVRGDHEANEGKIRRALGAARLELAPPERIEAVTKAPVGFAGPIGLEIPVWADHDIRGMVNAVTGANEADKHFVGVNLDRDFSIAAERFADLRNAAAADPCPRCDGALELRHAIEIGHVFKLGTKYSTALEARFADANEQLHPAIMGCYGIGVNRILASLIETSHDENGILWPMAIAPFEVVLTPLNVRETEVSETAELLYKELGSLGVDTLLDDRDQRPGVKFKDADLIGIPLRVVVGGRSLKDGQLEVKWRWEAEARTIPIAGAAAAIAGLVSAQRKHNRPTTPKP